MTSCASSGVAVLPVPIAQTGSYAITIVADLLGLEPVERGVELGDAVRHVLAGLADLQALADAQDRRDLVARAPP